jgi:hypothetical protein
LKKEETLKKYLQFTAIFVAMTMAIALLAAGSPARAADKLNILVIICTEAADRAGS